MSKMPFSVDKIRLRRGGVADFSSLFEFLEGARDPLSLRLSIKHKPTQFKSQR